MRGEGHAVHDEVRADESQFFTGLVEGERVGELRPYQIVGRLVVDLASRLVERHVPCGVVARLALGCGQRRHRRSHSGGARDGVSVPVARQDDPHGVVTSVDIPARVPRATGTAIIAGRLEDARVRGSPADWVGGTSDEENGALIRVRRAGVDRNQNGTHRDRFEGHLHLYLPSASGGQLQVEGESPVAEVGDGGGPPTGIQAGGRGELHTRIVRPQRIAQTVMQRSDEVRSLARLDVRSTFGVARAFAAARARGSGGIDLGVDGARVARNEVDDHIHRLQNFRVIIAIVIQPVRVHCEVGERGHPAIVVNEIVLINSFRMEESVVEVKRKAPIIPHVIVVLGVLGVQNCSSGFAPVVPPIVAVEAVAVAVASDQGHVEG